MSEIKPITRQESFLAKLGGQDVTTPTPITRTEQFLQAIIDNGGGGGGGGGVLIVHEDADGVLDKTWQEIYDADFAVVLSPLPFGDGVSRNIVTVVSSQSGYVVQCMSAMGGSTTFTNYSASTANDYPSYTE